MRIVLPAPGLVSICEPLGTCNSSTMLLLEQVLPAVALAVALLARVVLAVHRQ